MNKTKLHKRAKSLLKDLKKWNGLLSDDKLVKYIIQEFKIIELDAVIEHLKKP